MTPTSNITEFCNNGCCESNLDVDLRIAGTTRTPTKIIAATGRAMRAQMLTTGLDSTGAAHSNARPVGSKFEMANTRNKSVSAPDCLGEKVSNTFTQCQPHQCMLREAVVCRNETKTFSTLDASGTHNMKQI